MSAIQVGGGGRGGVLGARRPAERRFAKQFRALTVASLGGQQSPPSPRVTLQNCAPCVPGSRGPGLNSSPYGDVAPVSLQDRRLLPEGPLLVTCERMKGLVSA